MLYYSDVSAALMANTELPPCSMVHGEPKGVAAFEMGGKNRRKPN
jgi:hypothetical protein